jgi:hypothetical protein
MVPSQKDVLADYLSDLFADTAKQSVSDGATQPEDPCRDETDIRSQAQTAQQATTESDTASSVAGVNSRAEGELLTKTVSVSEETELDWATELSEELNKLSFEIGPEKQLACLFNLSEQPLNQLSRAQLSLILLDLLSILKQLPESQLKALLQRQYENVSIAKASVDSESVVV